MAIRLGTATLRNLESVFKHIGTIAITGENTSIKAVGLN